MGDLSPFVPEQSKTVEAIYAWHKAKGDAEPQRGYLGASIVGHECDRYLWYTFRGVVREEIEGRIYRLFETGDLEEIRFVTELRGIGYEVRDLDDQGEQFEVTDLGGHFSGHMDGAVLGVAEAPATWHVLEAKTHNAKSFAKLLKEGVQASKPMHWAQMQAYMGQTGMTRALYLARNKDTDALYSERVKFDSKAYKALMQRAARIIRTAGTPERVASRPDTYACKWCPAYALCWGVTHEGEEPKAAVPIPSKTCRSCVHSTPITEGNHALWLCERFNGLIEDTDVGADCPSHLLLPGLVSFAEATDAGDDFIEFTNAADKAVWIHGTLGWSTEQLIAGRGPLDATAPPLPDLGVDFDDLDLVARYPWEDSERLWDGPAFKLHEAINAFMGITAEELATKTPLAVQDDDAVNAAEYSVSLVDFLVVLYKHDKTAAIWRGKE